MNHSMMPTLIATILHLIILQVALCDPLKMRGCLYPGSSEGSFCALPTQPGLAIVPHNKSTDCTCFAGRQTFGNSRMTCLTNGTWSNLGLVCASPVQFKVLPQSQNKALHVLDLNDTYSIVGIILGKGAHAERPSISVHVSNSSSPPDSSNLFEEMDLKVDNQKYRVDFMQKKTLIGQFVHIQGDKFNVSEWKVDVYAEDAPPASHTCSRPRQPPAVNLYWLKTDPKVASYSCPPGYTTGPDHTFYCTDGKWNYPQVYGCYPHLPAVSVATNICANTDESDANVYFYIAMAASVALVLVLTVLIALVVCHYCCEKKLPYNESLGNSEELVQFQKPQQWVTTSCSIGGAPQSILYGSD